MITEHHKPAADIVSGIYFSLVTGFSHILRCPGAAEFLNTRFYILYEENLRVRSRVALFTGFE